MIQIKEVKTKKDLSDFIKFPDTLYKGNKYRVPPLHSFEKETLNAEKNPAFDFCEATYWLAYRDGKIVGRVAGIINHKFAEAWGENYARFGWIDFIDDYEVSGLLLKTVEDWAKAKGTTGVHGPLGFTDMDLEGSLVDGFEETATQAVIYNYPYYADHFAKLGYVKDVDWVQYEIIVPDKVPEKLERLSQLVQQKYNLRPLKAKKAKDLLPYAKGMFATLNEAFKGLYGFVPLTDKQIEYYTKLYFSMINPKFVCLVLDSNDEVVGFGVSLYSLSAAFIKAKGELYPFGFIHVLKDLYKNDKVDMLLQGVKPMYQNKGIPAIYNSVMMQAYIDNGVKTAITSHILEKNISGQLMFEKFEIRQHLRRRCYLKEFPKS
jgi:hypothetical protein